MTKEIIRFFILFVILVLSQVVVFNHFCLFGVAIDLFSNTQGMNALACTLTGIIRLPVLRLYAPRQDDITNPVPSVGSLGAVVFMKYAATIITLYCLLFFVIEAFAFFDIMRLLMRAAGSALLTFVIIIAFDGFTSRR